MAELILALALVYLAGSGDSLPSTRPDDSPAAGKDADLIPHSVTCACLPFVSSSLGDAAHTHTNCSFGCLGTYNASLSGFELSAGVNAEARNAEGWQVAGVSNFVGGRFRGLQTAVGVNFAARGLRGVQVAGGVNGSGAEVRGFQGAFGANVALEEVSGLQVAGGLNVCAGSVRGIQAAYCASFAQNGITGLQGAWVNATLGNVTGVQAGLAASVALGRVRGLQAAGLTFAKELRGCQVGLLNIGVDAVGAQIGLVNVSRTMHGASVGLLSISGSGHATLDGWIDEAAQLNIALGTSVSGTHNLYFVGGAPTTRPMTGSAGIGIGTHFPVYDVTGIVEGLASVLYAAGEDPGLAGMVMRLRLLGGWSMAPGLLTFAGPTVNLAVPWYGRDIPYPNLGVPFIAAESGPVRGWLGFTYGVRLFGR